LENEEVEEEVVDVEEETEEVKPPAFSHSLLPGSIPPQKSSNPNHNFLYKDTHTPSKNSIFKPFIITNF
jgi:hypothetical protein